MNRVAHPPAKPLLLYDGDCQFCTLWIHRWQLATGDFVEYLPFQDPRGGAKFPEIARTQFDAAVQLVMPDGSVVGAAHAVCRSLACNPEERWLWELYHHSPAFAGVLETAYRGVARHRRFFSAVTWLLWGRHLEPPRQNLVRWLFLRGLGVIYFAAFLSLWLNLGTLAGSQGSTSAARTLAAATQQFNAQGVGLNRYHLLPTLCWISTSDGFLSFQCGLGAALAVLLIVGVVPAPCLFLLWLIYLSLTAASPGPEGFQWQRLLLESGFLAIWFAPLQLGPRTPSGEASPSRLALWLLRFLLFRLLFESGLGQLLLTSGAWPQNFLDAVSLGMKLILPWAILLPRHPRQCAAAVLVAGQLLSLPASEHPLINLLTMLLCVTLLDDALIQSLLQKVFRRDFGLASPSPTGPRWPLLATLSVALLVGCACYAHAFEFIGFHMPGPEPVVAVARWLEPLRSINNYRPAP